LSATECTNPADSVHIVITRFIAKLSISVLVDLFVGRITMTPEKTAETAWNDALRHDGGTPATSFMACLCSIV